MASSGLSLFFNSSLILEKIKTLASTAIPIVKTIPAIPGNVKVADKIQVFNKGIIDNDNPEKIGYRTGSINFPKIINLEPLANALKDFIISIKNNSQPISNGEFGLETIKILEAISKSTKNKGKNIKF